MRDLHQLDRQPDGQFAERLEADLLRRLGDLTIDGPTAAEEAPMPIDLDTPTESHVSVRRSRTATVIAVAAAVVVIALVVALVRQPGDDDGTTPATTPAGPTTENLVFLVTPSTDGGDAETTGPYGSRNLTGMGSVVGDVTASTSMQGMANQSTSGHDGAEFVFAYLLDGAEVPLCGTGELMISAVVEYFETDGDPEALQPDGQWSGTWEVVPYSGRSELAGISGSGKVEGVLFDDGLTLTGTFTCESSSVNPPVR